MANENHTTGPSLELVAEFDALVKQDIEDVVKEARSKKWQTFLADKMATWTKQAQELCLPLPNARNRVPYHAVEDFKCEEIKIKKVTFNHPENTGLSVKVNEDKDGFAIDGVPELNDTSMPTNITILVEYYHVSFPDLYLAPIQLKILVNPDPKQLWKDVPVPENIEYPKKDAETDFIAPTAENSDKAIIAASKRGRSHAHEGKPRDDHFSINVTEEGWYVAVVADGAGSAPFSREGSRIACETVSRVCQNQLKQDAKLEGKIQEYGMLWQKTLLNDNLKPDSDKTVPTCQKETEYRKAVGDSLYNILGKAAFMAYTQIKGVANTKERKPKDYATTLLVSLCKKYDFGWFIASFWIGDGAIGVYDRQKNSVKLLCTPDEGEYSGQTRFLTMGDIFAQAESIYTRLRFCFIKEFSSLLLMTDGVTDAFFETDANLENPDKWLELLNNINNSLKEEENTLPTAEIQAQRLLKWLDFWSPGNHDDRTIIIIH